MFGRRNRMLRRAAVVATAAAVAAAVAIPAGAAGASPSARPGSWTCRGGSIPGGAYQSLTVRGQCNLDSGTVIVAGSVEVEDGAALNAAFGGSDLVVRRDVDVESGAILVLGCEPEQFICFNDPDQTTGTLSTDDRIGGDLEGDQALMMLVHKSIIGGSVEQNRGGGGAICTVFPLGPDGPPAYSTYEDNFVGGEVSITGLRTCWFGFIRNTVVDDVTLRNNQLGDPDGNEIVTNIVGGDSAGGPNIVAGRATGECRSLT